MEKLYLRDKNGEYEWIEHETFEGEKKRIKKYRAQAWILKQLDYAMDLSEIYKDPDLDVQPLEHVKNSERDLIHFGRNETISIEKRIEQLTFQKIEWTRILKKLEFAGKHTGSFHNEDMGTDTRYHVNELKYYIEVVINPLLEYLTREDTKPPSPLKGTDLNLKDIVKPDLWDKLLEIFEENEILDTRTLKPFPDYNQQGTLCALVRTLHKEGWTVKFDDKANPGVYIVANTFGVKRPHHTTYGNASFPQFMNFLAR